MIKFFYKHIKYQLSVLSILLFALLITFNVGNSQNNKIDKSKPLVISINSKDENSKINQQQSEKKYIFKNNILNNKENNDAKPKNNSQSTEVNDKKEKNQSEANKYDIASKNNIIKKYRFDKKIAKNADKSENIDKNTIKSTKKDDLQTKITAKKVEDTIMVEKIDNVKKNKTQKDIIEDKQINNNYKAPNRQNSDITADYSSKKNDNIFRNQNILPIESKNNYEDFEILNKEDYHNKSKNTLNLQENGNNIRQFMPLKPTPPRFFAADLSIPEKFANSNNLAKKSGSFYRAFGEIIYLQGTITDSFGVPINNVAIEIWQANSSGKYHSLLEADSEFIDKNFEMSGKTISNNLGNYQFITIMPGTSTNRAPHINMNIYHPQFGKLETEIYFANHPSNKDDYQYLSYNDSEKKLLTCKVEYSEINNPESIKLCIFNVVLKGIHQYKKF